MARPGGRIGEAFGAAATVALSVLLGGCAANVGGRQAFLGVTGPVNDFALPVQSLDERKFLTVVRQRYDFSCGSAALATLLRYHYGEATDEAAVFRGMWRDGDRAQIQRVGFSLLDMKRFLAGQGLRADGFKVDLDRIRATGVPGIALITVSGYRHFVVVKGVSDRELLIGDPALGLRTVARRAFEASWNGVYFVLNSKLDVGRRGFNTDAQWASFSRAPADARFTEPLSLQALALTAPFFRDF